MVLGLLFTVNFHIRRPFFTSFPILFKHNRTWIYPRRWHIVPVVSIDLLITAFYLNLWVLKDRLKLCWLE